MVSRLQGDPLHVHARRVLTQSKPSCKSWFWKVREISLRYSLPHPLSLLDNPPTKESFKKTIKSKVVDFWEQKLRSEASQMISLVHFQPKYMSLQSPHPIWSTVGSNPYEISKAIQQARLLSGRYRTQYLVSHWSSNLSGHCSAPGCENNIETVKHIIIDCVAYNSIRNGLEQLWKSSGEEVVYNLVCDALTRGDDYLLQFILDCSVLPSVIRAVQAHSKTILEKLFYLTRTWCFSIHRARMKNLGRWNFK